MSTTKASTLRHPFRISCETRACKSKKNSTSLPRPPPIPPRQTKSDDKPTTSTAPLILVKQSNPITSSSNDNNNIHPTKGLSILMINKKKLTKFYRIIK